METLFAIGLGQGITLSFLLFFKSSANRNATWLIGVFVFCISAYLSAPLLNAFLGEPRGSFLIDPLILLLGPSFYGYILSLSGHLNYKRLMIHAIPFLLYLPVLLYFYQLVQVDLNSFQSLQHVYSSTLAVALGIFKFLHLLVYVGLCFYALQKHQERVKIFFSDLKGKDLAWVRYMLYGFLFLSILSLLMYLLALQIPEKQELLTTINLLLLLLFLITITIYAFRQKTVFDTSYDWLGDDVADDSAPNEKVERLPKYEKSGLKSAEIELINNQLDSFIDEKGFLDPELSLTTMAAQLGVAPHKLSEVLSKHRKTSFYDLINYHRIEAVKFALHDPAKRHLSVLGIAYDCGYNSKSTFNTAFKKFTGVSPSEFRSVKF